MSAEKKIIDLCEIHGYGRVMQVASEQWAKKADAMELGGSHLVIGPCGSRVEPCECDTQNSCAWCRGSGWLTSHVKSLKTAGKETVTTNNYFQLATGVGIREETIDYIVENNENAVNEAVRKAFASEMSDLAVYKSHTQRKPNKFGKISLYIKYLDQCGDEETTVWQLRPVSLFK